jgi:Fe2+ transport system protein FeoA
VLRYLSELGVTIGASIEVLNRVPYDGTVQVRINGASTPVALGLSLTAVICLSTID